MSVLGVAFAIASQGQAASSRRVRSVFHIEKSQNRNQVHYDVRVDGSCRPAGEAPVFGYWRDLEEGPRVVSGLTFFERRAYGVADGARVQGTSYGGMVRFSLRALPERDLIVQTYRSGGECRGAAWTRISGMRARLRSVYVKVAFLGADYVVLRGQRIDGTPVHERIDPRRRRPTGKAFRRR
jgi:hypothetical protein